MAVGLSKSLGWLVSHEWLIMNAHHHNMFHENQAPVKGCLAAWWPPQGGPAGFLKRSYEVRTWIVRDGDWCAPRPPHHRIKDEKDGRQRSRSGHYMLSCEKSVQTPKRTHTTAEHTGLQYRAPATGVVVPQHGCASPHTISTTPLCFWHCAR